jgi:hypothetical protein
VKELLETINRDIATVEGYLRQRGAATQRDSSAGRAVAVYTEMLYELYDRRRAIMHYLEKEEANK